MDLSTSRSVIHSRVHARSALGSQASLAVTLQRRPFQPLFCSEAVLGSTRVFSSRSKCERQVELHFSSSENRVDCNGLGALLDEPQSRSAENAVDLFARVAPKDSRTRKIFLNFLKLVSNSKPKHAPPLLMLKIGTSSHSFLGWLRKTQGRRYGCLGATDPHIHTRSESRAVPVTKCQSLLLTFTQADLVE